ncbi:hypothetical protein [Humibacter sp.]|uniref:hypothetical protein n=1 Tax=Humibacter sp. TaxID=1940291 RepID=UPI003F807219
MAEYRTATEALTLHERARDAVEACPLHGNDPEALRAVLAEVRAQQLRESRTLPSSVWPGGEPFDAPNPHDRVRGAR